MRIIAMADGGFGLFSLQALLRSQEVEAVIPCASGDTASGVESVAGFCRQLNIPLGVEEEVAELIAQRGPDALFLLDWPRPVPPALYKRVRVVSLQPSLLPSLKGPRAISRALISGARKTGVSLYLPAERPEDELLIGQSPLWIDKEDTVQSLTERLGRAAEALVDLYLPALESGRVETQPMPETAETECGPIDTSATRIRWMESSWDIYNLVRGLTRPSEGARTELLGDEVIVWRVICEDGTGILMPGEFDIEDDKVYVGAKWGAVRLEEIQWRGETRRGIEIAATLQPHWPGRFK